MAEKESSPIDAKKFPFPILMGGILMILGMIIVILGMLSLISSAVGEDVLGIFKNMFVMLIGAVIVAIGGAIAFFGLLGKLLGRRSRRFMY